MDIESDSISGLFFVIAEEVIVKERCIIISEMKED